MMSIFYESISKDISVMMRHRAEWVQSLVFFIVFISLFGIGLGFDNQMLMSISPAIIWIAFLLTSLFTIESIFRREMESGTLEQLALSPHPLWWLLLAKAAALWLVSCLPLILLLPILSMFMQLDIAQTGVFVLCLLLGSPAITLLGMIGVLLTLSMPRSGLFLGIILLPLYVPVLILGESAVVLLFESTLPIFQMTLLAAISVLTLTLAPHGAAGALSVAMD
ncbi:MAG: heme exporter protein CcmB [Candidatus Berkiella sp.]